MKLESNLRSNKTHWIFGAVVIVIGAIAIYAKNRSDSTPSDQSVNNANATEVASSVDEPGQLVVGGISRPATDVKLPTTESNSQKREVPEVRQGFSPAVTPNANSQVEGLAQALRTREKPNQFSSFAPPEPFDVESYKANPEAYIATVEPGRVYAPAQPADGVPVINAVGKRFHRLRQGESVRLRVSALAGAPVSFSSSRLGQFENQLTSITVRAGDDGVAEATFTASGGTIDEVPILAASPMASGQVSFTLLVSVP